MDGLAVEEEEDVGKITGGTLNSRLIFYISKYFGPKLEMGTHSERKKRQDNKKGKKLHY